MDFDWPSFRSTKLYVRLHKSLVDYNCYLKNHENVNLSCELPEGYVWKGCTWGEELGPFLTPKFEKVIGD